MQHDNWETVLSCRPWQDALHCHRLTSLPTPGLSCSQKWPPHCNSCDADRMKLPGWRCKTLPLRHHFLSLVPFASSCCPPVILWENSLQRCGDVFSQYATVLCLYEEAVMLFEITLCSSIRQGRVAEPLTAWQVLGGAREKQAAQCNSFLPMH